MTVLDPLLLFIIGYFFMVAFMLVLWGLHLLVRNASIADVGFCAGLITTVIWYVTQASGETERKLLVAAMVCIYAGRLGGYIFFNRVIDQAEDARYQLLRRRWGEWKTLKMFGYFQLQAAAVAAFSLPFLVVIQNPRPPFHFWELGGFFLWIVAVSGEALADRQLARFRAKPWNHDRVCRDGLWFYSRHPNYFFEWLHWCAFVVIAIGAPGWPLTLIGPIAMGWALLKVTGIPLAEEQAIRSRGEAYREYQRRTNAFFPWPPNRS
jgi:steroid 5-alpha reductase family enzyme